MNRAETIEGTAEMVSARDGKGIAIQTDHLIPQQVAALIEGSPRSRTDVSICSSTTSGAVTIWRSG
jgi:hypothetical protein